MIVQVLPAIRLPRNTEFYSYSVPLEYEKKVKVGQIIEISFRNKILSGVITKIEKDLPRHGVARKFKYPLKEFNKILFSEILITSEQIKLIKYISENCSVAPSIVVKSMIPAIPKRQKKIKTKQQNNKTTKQQNKFSKKILWFGDQIDLFKELKTKIKNQKGQILILVPEIELIEKIIEKLELKEKDCIKNDSHVAMGKHFKNWLEILSGSKKIIIGTKISVLLPFSNLEEIIIFNSHDWNHKQSEINPRFDARIVAEWLAHEHKCKLILTTPAPSVEEYKDLSTKRLKHKKTYIKLIDLKQEKFKGNYTFLSDEMTFRIDGLLQENLSHKSDEKKVLIFHNRKGLANYVFCKDCNHVFKCPECQISLAYHTNDKKLHCHHCNHSEEIFPMCPKCSGSNIEFKGQGAERIKSELQKEFKESKILVLEKTSTQKHLNTESLKHADIVIGTEFMMNKVDFDKFDLIVFTNFDQILNRPDFRTQEKAYQLFNTIKSQVSNSDILIQTSDPENIVLESIVFNAPEKFYKAELKNRKLLNYPPFKNLIKIICKDIKESSAQYKSKKLVLNLRKNFNDQIEILGPFESFPKKTYNKYNYNIILKVPIDFDTSKLFKTIPNDFIIDVNPEKLN